MKPYGRKNPIMHGPTKNRRHSRKGNVCPICNNTKVDKNSERQRAKRDIEKELFEVPDLDKITEAWEKEHPEEARSLYEKARTNPIESVRDFFEQYGPK